jgi:hypothetical protein
MVIRRFRHDAEFLSDMDELHRVGEAAVPHHLERLTATMARGDRQATRDRPQHRLSVSARATAALARDRAAMPSMKPEA